MDKNILYSLYDSGARYFNPPVVTNGVPMLKRALDSQLRDSPNAPMFEYPEDFVVFELGEIELDSGVITPFFPPRRVGSVAELMTRRVGTVPPLDVTVPTDTKPSGYDEADGFPS